MDSFVAGTSFECKLFMFTEVFSSGAMPLIPVFYLIIYIKCSNGFTHYIYSEIVKKPDCQHRKHKMLCSNSLGKEKILGGGHVSFQCSCPEKPMDSIFRYSPCIAKRADD